MEAPGNSEDGDNPTNSDGYGHPADKMFSLYLKEAEKVDHQMVEDWKGTTDGILIFAGLFSAVVTAFLIESYKSLSEDTDADSATVALLAQISSQLTIMNNFSQPSTIQPPPLKGSFSPSTISLAVNAMWFLSLSLSLICALAATLVQYWARNYARSVERYQQSTHKRGLIRALMFEGLEKSHVGEIVEAIPTLIHVALFLFLTGLFTFLYEINILIAYLVFVILASSAVLYGVAAILPLFRPESALRTPFSSVLWYIWHYSSRVLFPVTSDVLDTDQNNPGVNIYNAEDRAYWGFLESKFTEDNPFTWMIQSSPPVAPMRYPITSIAQKQEQAASTDDRLRYVAWKRVARALTWIRGLANEDHEFEAFLVAVPGCSAWQPSLLPQLVEQDPQLLGDIRKFFLKTIPFAWAPGGRIQKNRAVACMEAMYHLAGAVSFSPIHWDLKWKIHQAPLLFVSDLAGYLQYCDKMDLSLIICTMTACLSLREPTLAKSAREIVFYPNLKRSRQYIDQMLQFRVELSPEAHPRSIHNPSLPFDFVIRSILPELSRAEDRVEAYKHTLVVIEAIWQAVQEPRAPFEQATFVNFLDKLLAEYSGKIEASEPNPVVDPGLLPNTLTNMVTGLLEATRFLDDYLATLQAVSVLSKYLDSNPLYGAAEARMTLQSLERRAHSEPENAGPRRANGLPVAP